MKWTWNTIHYSSTRADPAHCPSRVWPPSSTSRADSAHCYSRASPSSSSTFNNGYITYNLRGDIQYHSVKLLSLKICDRSLRNKLFLTHLWRPQLKPRYAYDKSTFKQQLSM